MENHLPSFFMHILPPPGQKKKNRPPGDTIPTKAHIPRRTVENWLFPPLTAFYADACGKIPDFSENYSVDRSARLPVVRQRSSGFGLILSGR
jgi:hypothetical protein